MIKLFAGAALAFAFTAAPVLAQASPPAQISIDNKRPAMLSELVIADDQGNVVGRLAKPLAAGKKSAIRLRKAKGCNFTVQAKFDDEGEVEETLNLCKEKVLRFVE